MCSFIPALNGTPQIQFMKKSLELYFRLEERM
ncbi:MAG: hypothetical protein MjAS7_1829 [Metallosphaera javensis (ex Sakai et al. 2022)]|nr:MAG: hypothetical protein MjAS7_1829 [Metallosphaera javensis (ex Sakai et al. 2022)]